MLVLLTFCASAYNAPPVVTNLDTTVTVNENVGADFTVIDLAAVDTSVYTQIYLNLRSSSSTGIEMYELVGKYWMIWVAAEEAVAVK